MPSPLSQSPNAQTRPAAAGGPLRIGIIGAGMFAGTSHVPALRSRPGVEITCACRTREAKLRHFCETYDIARGYTDHREMLDKEAGQLDGVVVASTHELHFTHAMDCLERGLPVLLEKPMTLTMREADALLARVRATGLPVVIGYHRHYWPCYLRAREMLARGDLGAPRVLSAAYCKDQEWAIARTATAVRDWKEAFYEEGDPPNFRGDPTRSGGGFLVDAGTHIAEMICWLLDDDPVRVHAMLDSRGHGTDLDGVINVAFRGGALAAIHLVGAAQAHAGSGVTIYGTGGTLRAWNKVELYYAAQGELQRVPELPEMDHPASNFVDVLRGQAAIGCSVIDGRRAVALVEAAYASAQSGAAVATAL